MTITGVGLGYHASISRRQRVVVARLQQFGEVDYASRNHTHPDGISVGGKLFNRSFAQNLLEPIYGEPVTYVSLWGPNVTDDSLRPLEELTDIQWLNISSNKVSDSGMKYLAGLTELRILELWLCPITDNGFDAMPLEAMQNLEVLSLGGSEISNNSLLKIARLSKLRSLSLQRCRRVTDAGLAHLKDLKKLRHLDLVNTRVTPKGLSEFKASLPTCRLSR
jgi:hypothetical protein